MQYFFYSHQYGKSIPFDSIFKSGRRKTLVPHHIDEPEDDNPLLSPQSLRQNSVQQQQLSLFGD